MSSFRNPREGATESEEMVAIRPDVDNFKVPPATDDHSVVVSSEEQREDSNIRGETEEDRRRREEEESIELARMLMAEEAMASYEQHFMILRQNANAMSQEEVDAWQAAMREEEREEAASMEGEDGEISYDAMLELGERIGDVKAERWTFVAQTEINKLPTFTISLAALLAKTDKGATECKCLVCQSEYENDDECRRLPCSHGFHKACVDQWLLSKDICPYCRQSIVVDTI